MSTVAVRNVPLDTGILLEAGTNELEVLVLELGGARYGVNVAKVREVLPAMPVTALPVAHEAVEGVVRIRENVVEVVNLDRFLDVGAPADARTGDLLLVLEFNSELLAFRVHAVERIYRISWTQMQPMPKLRETCVPITGVLQLDGRLVLMLDFETIGATIGLSRAVRQMPPEQAVAAATDIREALIVLVEDSQMITSMALDALATAGFGRVQAFADGQDAWEYLERLAADPAAIPPQGCAIVSDIEMPRMDGLTLTRKVRGCPPLAKLPIVLFSSIVSRDNEKKGRQVGADAQVTKPRYGELIGKLHQLLAVGA